MLTAGLKIAKQAENNAAGYRERVEELERRLSDDRRSLTASVRQSDKPTKEVMELLRNVYVKVSQVLNLDVSNIIRVSEIHSYVIDVRTTSRTHPSHYAKSCPCASSNLSKWQAITRKRYAG
jgi:hypothetical protein